MEREKQQAGLETRPAKIRARAKQKEAENWAFRAFLKVCDETPEEIDIMVREIYGRVAGQVNCQTCANCCKVAPPSLSPEDIKRLSMALNTSTEYVCERYLKENPEGGGITFQHMPCPFLKGTRCGVYAARPNDCRSYPHLDLDRFVDRLIEMVQNCAICPIVFHVWEDLKKQFGNQIHNSTIK